MTRHPSGICPAPSSPWGDSSPLRCSPLLGRGLAVVWVGECCCNAHGYTMCLHAVARWAYNNRQNWVDRHRGSHETWIECIGRTPACPPSILLYILSILGILSSTGRGDAGPSAGLRAVLRGVRRIPTRALPTRALASAGQAAQWGPCGPAQAPPPACRVRWQSHQLTSLDGCTPLERALKTTV